MQPRQFLRDAGFFRREFGHGTFTHGSLGHRFLQRVILCRQLPLRSRHFGQRLGQLRSTGRHLCLQSLKLRAAFRLQLRLGLLRLALQLGGFLELGLCSRQLALQQSQLLTRRSHFRRSFGGGCFFDSGLIPRFRQGIVDLLQRGTFGGQFHLQALQLRAALGLQLRLGLLRRGEELVGGVQLFLGGLFLSRQSGHGGFSLLALLVSLCVQALQPHLRCF